MAIIDATSFHNEDDMFDLRYRMLEPYVDEFIVLECTSTFGGLPKPLNFERIKGKYPKVKYVVNNDDYSTEEIEAAQLSPNTAGLQRWMHEFLQKERLQGAMSHLNDDDTVFIGDVDEIWDPKILEGPIEGVRKLRLRVYCYYLNLRSSEEFCGPIVAKYKDIKGQCLNHLRNNGPNNTKEYWGWHFTNMGGYDAVKMKVFDQYNPEVFGNDTWMNLTDRFGVKDYVGRNFIFTEDESEWPEFLKINRERYSKLCKS